MARLKITNPVEKLRVKAAAHENSVEDDVLGALCDTLAGEPLTKGLGRRTGRRFQGLNGVDLELPARAEPPRSPDF